jgi:predicted aminopeptidase
MRDGLLAGIGLIALLATGCSSARYYTQAVQGHCQIMSRARPIERVLADTSTPPAVRTKLELILELRRFAETNLHLPANGHYLRYADLSREYVVWNVEAAPEFSLKPKNWWYPFVGRLSYRGYFDEQMARDEAARLLARGYDTHVGGVEAYSTLGWFRDPVLNTFIQRDEAALADLIFHELAHQRLFAKSDTDFNEAFAVAVARAGVRQWLQAKGDSTALAKWEAEERCREQFVLVVQRTRHELVQLYAATNTPPAIQRERKAAVLTQFQRLVREWKGESGCDGEYSAWLDQPVNNARLNTVATYYDLVPAFERLLAECAGDWERFFTRVEKIARLPKAARREALSSPAPMTGKVDLLPSGP